MRQDSTSFALGPCCTEQQCECRRTPVSIVTKPCCAAEAVVPERGDDLHAASSIMPNHPGPKREMSEQEL